MRNVVAVKYQVRGALTPDSRWAFATPLKPPRTSPLLRSAAVLYVHLDRGASDASGPAVADGDLAALDDDGDPAPAARVHEHLVEEGAGLLDVAILDGISLAGVGLPGLARVRSAVLAVDDDGSLAHIF